MADTTIINYHIYPPGTIPDPRMDQALALLQQLKQDDTRMSGQLTDLTAAQKATDDAVQAATAEMADVQTVLASLAGKIASAGTDPTALKAIVDDLNTQSGTLATATASLKTAADALKDVPPVATPPAPPAGTPPSGDTPPAPTV